MKKRNQGDWYLILARNQKHPINYHVKARETGGGGQKVMAMVAFFLQFIFTFGKTS